MRGSRNANTGETGNPDRANLLSYAVSPPRRGSRLEWPILLGVLQFFWIVLFMSQTLGWDRPKRIVADSMFMLLVGLPSIAACIVSVRVLIQALRGRHHLAIATCLVLCGISLGLLSLLATAWVSDVLCDPKGRWRPL